MKNNFYYKGNFSNIYKKPSKFSEVTSQILYGEKFKILLKNKKWIKIKSSFDNYIGFVKNAQYVEKFEPYYKVSSLYEPHSDSGIKWDSIGYKWPSNNPIVSERDQSFSPMNDFQSPFKV